MIGFMVATTFAGTSLTVILLRQLIGHRRLQLLERLERYGAASEPDSELQGDPAGPEPGRRRSLLGQAAVFEKYLLYLRRELARTDVLLRPEEFLAGELLTGLVIFAFLYFGGQSILVALPAGAAGVYAWHIFLQRSQGARQRMYDDQTVPALELIAGSLKAGYSFLQAVAMVATESDPPLAAEFNRLLREVKMGVSLETALHDLVARVGTEDMELVVTAILIQRQVGGNLAEILENISHTIRERIQLKKELKALTAQGRLSAMVVIALPPSFAAMVSVLNPEFMLPLITEPAGRIMLILAVIMQILGIVVIRRIINIEL